MEKKEHNPKEDYQEIIDLLIKHYGENWLRELGRLIVEGDKLDTPPEAQD